MVTYQEESFIDIVEELTPLIYEHWEEIALHKDKIKLNPDFNKYIEADELGLIHILTAREEEELIGYFISFVQPHLHYMDTLFAVNDVLFVTKKHRKGRVGYILFKKAEESLKEIGVDVIMIHAKVHADFKPLMDSLGYDRVEYNYSKYIGDC